MAADQGDPGRWGAVFVEFIRIASPGKGLSSEFAESIRGPANDRSHAPSNADTIGRRADRRPWVSLRPVGHRAVVVDLSRGLRLVRTA